MFVNDFLANRCPNAVCLGRSPLLGVLHGSLCARPFGSHQRSSPSIERGRLLHGASGPTEKLQDSRKTGCCDVRTLWGCTYLVAFLKPRGCRRSGTQTPGGVHVWRQWREHIGLSDHGRPHHVSESKFRSEADPAPVMRSGWVRRSGQAQWISRVRARQSRQVSRLGLGKASRASFTKYIRISVQE